MDKTFAEFINESNEPEQLDEATTRGKAMITVADKEITEAEGFLVYKPDGGASNVEMDFKYKRGKFEIIMKFSSGVFKDIKEYRIFNKTIMDLREKLDEVEILVQTGRAKKAAALLKKIGFSVQVDS